MPPRILTFVAGFTVALLTGCTTTKILPDTLIDASNPETIRTLVESEGYDAELINDGSLPLISVQSEHGPFWLYFDYCDDDGADCEVITFATGIDLEDPNISQHLFNDWNADKFGAAYLDEEGDPHLSLSVNMLNGVSKLNFTDILHWWVLLMEDFAELVNPDLRKAIKA